MHKHLDIIIISALKYSNNNFTKYNNNYGEQRLKNKFTVY